MNTWETYTIKIEHEPSDHNVEKVLGDITDNFETRLYRLIREYQGQAGLKFTVTNSVDQPIVEY